MKKVLTLSVLLAGLAGIDTPMLAHHGRGATYDMNGFNSIVGSTPPILLKYPPSIQL